MSTILMRARVPLVHAGTPRAAGEAFPATPVEAAILRYQQRADFAPVGAPSDATGQAPRKKRAYKRRDLQAEA